MAAPAPTAAPVATAGDARPVIGVIFYSLYGHIGALAEQVIKGVEAAGAIAKPFQIQETLSEEILEKMKGGGSLKPKYPIVTPNDLKELDGFLLGAPTRYGRLPAQVSAFFDQTGGLWATGALHGKFGATFTSTASLHGGQETTHLTTIPFFAHHGIIYVPIGYTQPYLTDLTEVHGGSPYGTSTLAGGDGSRQPTEGELRLAAYQGEYFAKTVAQSVRGRHLLAAGTAGGAAAAPGAPAVSNKAVDPTSGDAAAAAQTGATGTGAGAGAGTAAAVGAGAAGAAAVGAGAAGAAAAKAVPTDNEPAGYQVVDKPVDGAAPVSEKAAAAAEPATAAPGAADASAAIPADSAAAAAAPTAVNTTTVTADGTPAPHNVHNKPTRPAPTGGKKGGLFSCCSGNNID